ncbi:MAG: DUF3078 domain-containing protein [Fimbriimonadaceae bacterium]|nr:DUF3078 domain-containing protein [Chitinophagales bacterium]
MKKIILLLTAIYFLSNNMMAQIEIAADTTWKRGGGAVLNFNQIGLTNWAAGGESALSTVLLANFFANYKFAKTSWDNTLNINYGLITANNYADIRKNDDKIEMNSKYGRYAFGKFYYSALINFLTQFTEGFDYVSDPEALDPISNFLSPGYLTVALGMDYKPNDKFSLFLSPATGKFTIVTNDAISNEIIDSVNLKNLYGVKVGETVRAEFGASVIAALTTNLTENVSEVGKLTLFNNFTDPIAQNRGNIDIGFTNTIAMKLNKFITASLYLELIYDHDILIPTYDENDVQTGVSPKTQFKEVIGFGFSYNFGAK